MTDKEKSRNDYVEGQTSAPILDGKPLSNEELKAMVAKNSKTPPISLLIRGALLASVIYPLYSIGNLPDKLPHERAYVAAGLLGGAAATIAGMGGWTAQTELQKKIAIIGASTFSTSFVYSVGRGVFKQSPKNSLIAGLVITGTIGAFMWYNSKLNFKSNSNTVLDRPKMASNLK